MKTVADLSARDEAFRIQHALLETLALVRLVRSELESLTDKRIDEPKDLGDVALSVNVITSRLEAGSDLLDLWLVKHAELIRRQPRKRRKPADLAPKKTNVIDLYARLKESLAKGTQ